MDSNPEIVKKMPLVSILMLTYNRADFIKEAIVSVLQQTYLHWELFIVDDGSTDNTEEIIESFQDVRIKYIKHQTNLGLIARRKESLGYANGVYTAILDSDDLWIDVHKLEEQVQYLTEHSDVSLVGTFINLIDSTGKKIGDNQYEITDKNIRKNILLRNQFTNSSVLMRTALIKKTSGYKDTILAEDYELFLQIGLTGTFANLPKYYTAYRIHENSFNHKRLLMAQAVLNIVKSYKKYYPNYWLALAKCYFRILFNYFN